MPTHSGSVKGVVSLGSVGALPWFGVFSASVLTSTIGSLDSSFLWSRRCSVRLHLNEHGGTTTVGFKSSFMYEWNMFLTGKHSLTLVSSSEPTNTPTCSLDTCEHMGPGRLSSRRCLIVLGFKRRVTMSKYQYHQSWLISLFHEGCLAEIFICCALL